MGSSQDILDARIWHNTAPQNPRIRVEALGFPRHDLVASGHFDGSQADGNPRGGPGRPSTFELESHPLHRIMKVLRGNRELFPGPHDWDATLELLV